VKTKFEVYLNRKAMGRSPKRVYSLRDNSRIVKFSNSMVLLENVELVVQQAGREETLRRTQEKRKVQKTVHAFLRGGLVRRGRNAKKVWRELLENGLSTSPVGYDPKKTSNWLKLTDYKMPDDCSDMPAATTAKYAFLHEDGILIAN